jgi:thioredoxin reductase (NADPH)
VDELVPLLGFVTRLGPLERWGLEVDKGAIVVDSRMQTNLPRVWACGDVTTFDTKLKLIATGFAEAAVAVAQAMHVLRPDVSLQPKYSTNTGVPGVAQEV